MRRTLITIAAAAVLSMLVMTAGAQQPGAAKGGGNNNKGKAAAPPPGPVPRNAKGRVIIGGEVAGKNGVWLPGVGTQVPAAKLEDVKFQPWAKALYDERQKHELEPHARCKASGTSRQFLTPYGVEFTEIPELQRIFIFDIGGPHTFRTVYMDGRSHPANPAPSYYGHSIGWWDGDTLVIDTVGFNEAFWLDRRGLPHTTSLHTIERFTRINAAAIRYEVTVDDPGAYTAPWNAQFNLRLERGTELFEYVCQQANYAKELMVGDDRGAVGASSAIVP